jgi:hypothetical protein
MIPPGKTTLYRMQLAAQNEAERIEISQDGMVKCGMQKVPRTDQVALRDDFAGIVRMIDAIESDQFLLERLKERMARAPEPLTAAATATHADEEIEAA